MVLVLTTVPDDESAETLARALVDERLAACVNVLPPMISIYRWNNSIERGTERQLLIKTTRDCVAALQTRLKALHSYEVPELLILPVEGGSEDYLGWVIRETQRNV